jgi:thiol-disulfide isomerase/thioredoxin
LVSQEVEKVLAVAFVVVLIAAAWATTTLLSPGSEGVPKGARRPAPDFTRPLLSGPDFVLSEHRGKIIIVDFWATWCGPCEVQMPVLDALWKRRGPGAEDLMIVGVSVDTDPVEKVLAWIEERELEYPIALGDQDLAQRYGVIGYPTLLIIDPNGGIHTQHVGVLSRPELEAIFEEIRSEAPPAG